ncbi:MAG: serine protein kinase [Planctomycetes bacterium]|jgi:serine protein kinase|nr:serine protein kinase [Planctomycetota bacterium]MCL4729296.1 serine protein kinase [Planctomycetota bacterium]
MAAKKSTGAASISQILDAIGDSPEVRTYRDLQWQGSFSDYLKLVTEDPRIVRNAHQRMYDMILSHGSEDFVQYKERLVRYKFFSDPFTGGRDAVFGIERQLMQLVSHFKSAAYNFGTEKRVLLLHGPVGSAKSTITRLLKRGLEKYSRTSEGRLYTFGWKLKDEVTGADVIWSPMHEDPLKLIPAEPRARFLQQLNESHNLPYKLRVDGDLDPLSRKILNDLLNKHGGNWREVVDNYIVVKRLLISEKDRVGIGTFQPKDEKNQDATELTGDVNYRKIAFYGVDSDPRAFNFDGEFNVANRGLVEFIEVLKLDVAFLYDLLGASQEHSIKPKKFPQTDIDEVIIGHTNEPEYRRLQSNELMEAFRDRTVKIDVPYNTVLDHEIRIYNKDFKADRVNKHIAPHTIEIAAMWAILTRLEDPKRSGLSLLQKLKLYNGKAIPGFTEDNIRELRAEAKHEGMHGISPRYIQDKISNAIVNYPNTDTVNPFMVMNELEEGLKHHSLISSEETKKRYKELLGVVRQEYEEIAKNEVQRAISADEEAIARLCSNYIDHVKAYTQRERVRNKYTGELEEADERFMRSIEEKIDIQDSRKDDFRREIMNYIGALALEGRTFDYKTNERLHRALELKLFEDQKDSIKLTSLVSNVVDKETQAKIDVVKQRLIDRYGYNDTSATDLLNFVASIFARGDIKD